MAVRIWLITLILVANVVVATMIFVGPYDFMVDTMNASATGLESTAQTTMNSIVTMLKWVFGAAIGVEIFGLIIWALVSPQRREMESYLND